VAIMDIQSGYNVNAYNTFTGDASGYNLWETTGVLSNRYIW
jgi:hypothetical protein